MSRIGNRILTFPENVSVEYIDNNLKIKGPKGELDLEINNSLNIKIENNNIIVEKIQNTKEANMFQGTFNSLIKNMIEGVSEGFSKTLEMVGVGYRFQLQGNNVVINVGFAHLVNVEIPEGIEVEQISNTEIIIKGINKELVGEFAANIRKIKKPEPYKGKGIRYKGEYVRRKEGKKAA